MLYVMSVAAARSPPRRDASIQARLLAVVLQHLIAGLGDLGAILLQAGQNGEVTLIDHGATVLLHVTRTGFLLFDGAAALLALPGLLCERRVRKRKRQQGESKKIFTHRVPSF
jgi:hypothetical protein